MKVELINNCSCKLFMYLYF